jgi:hypothetical protein
VGKEDVRLRRHRTVVPVARRVVRGRGRIPKRQCQVRRQPLTLEPSCTKCQMHQIGHRAPRVAPCEGDPNVLEKTGTCKPGSPPCPNRFTVCHVCFSVTMTSSPSARCLQHRLTMVIRLPAIRYKTVLGTSRPAWPLSERLRVWRGTGRYSKTRMCG